MRNTGVVRRVDDLGRVVIPRDIRKALGIVEGTPLEIYIDNQDLVLKKYIPTTEERQNEVLIETLDWLQGLKNPPTELIEKISKILK